MTYSTYIYSHIQVCLLSFLSSLCFKSSANQPYCSLIKCVSQKTLHCLPWGCQKKLYISFFRAVKKPLHCLPWSCQKNFYIAFPGAVKKKIFIAFLLAVEKTFHCLPWDCHKGLDCLPRGCQKTLGCLPQGCQKLCIAFYGAVKKLYIAFLGAVKKLYIATTQTSEITHRFYHLQCHLSSQQKMSLITNSRRRKKSFKKCLKERDLVN